MEQKIQTPRRIQETLVKCKEGLSKDYDILLSQLADESLSDEDLFQYFQGLKACVALMDKKVETLVGVILKMHWISRGSKFVTEYQNFILNLVSAHTYYLKSILKMIVSHSIPNVKFNDGEEHEIDEEMKNMLSKQSLHLHTLLQSITKIVPMTPKVLVALLADMFPYHGKPSIVLQSYVQNLLHITLYLPKERPQILELLIDKMIQLDVRCPREELQCLDDGEEDDDDTGIFDMDGVVSNHEKKLPSLAVKLDILMEVVLLYIHDVCYSNDQLDWEATKKLYKELLVAFEKIILPTYASCHVQFIIFYICSFNEPLSEGFLDYLWKNIQDPNMPNVFRQATVAYMASFLARAKYLSASTLKAVLDLMMSWVHAYIHHTADLATKVEFRAHSTFYAVCQAVFYILAFRHKDLLETKGGIQFCQTLNLQSVVMCRLNPLKFCTPAVVNTFSCVARQHQLAFCDTIIEKNKRNQLPATNDDSAPHLVSEGLHSLFPFDPYLLPRSSVYICPLYKEYDGIMVPDDDDDVENQEEDQYMEVDQSPECSDDKEMIKLSPIQKTNKSSLASSFTDFMLGASPGFKHA